MPGSKHAQATSDGKGRGSHHTMGGRAQERGGSGCLTLLDRAVAALVAWSGGRRKGEGGGQRDGFELPGVGGLLHLEWD